MTDPTHPQEVGRWWLPGMWRAGGEEPTWIPGKRFALHHSIIFGSTAYGAGANEGSDG
jgi:hypothetical protein